MGRFQKLAAGGVKRHAEVAAAVRNLGLHACILGMYLTDEFALWLDLRTSDDDGLHCNGRRVENASEAITIQIAKAADAHGALNNYLYVLMDAQLNIENGRFFSAIY